MLMLSQCEKNRTNRCYGYLFVPGLQLVVSLLIGFTGHKKAEGIRFPSWIDFHLGFCWACVLLFVIAACTFHYSAKKNMRDKVISGDLSIKYSSDALASSLSWHCAYLCAISSIVFFSSYTFNIAHLAYLAIYVLEGIALFLSYYDYCQDNRFNRLKWFSNTELIYWFGITFCVFVTLIDRFYLDLAGTKTLFNAVFALVIIQYADQLYKQRINRKNEYYGVKIIS